jgi:excisionase family DNA binding protein
VRDWWQNWSLWALSARSSEVNEMSTNKYITTAEVAAYLGMSAKFVRSYLIGRNKVAYVKLDRKYLIDRASFRAWEEVNTKRVTRKV